MGQSSSRSSQDIAKHQLAAGAGPAVEPANARSKPVSEPANEATPLKWTPRRPAAWSRPDSAVDSRRGASLQSASTAKSGASAGELYACPPDELFCYCGPDEVASSCGRSLDTAAESCQACCQTCCSSPASMSELATSRWPARESCQLSTCNELHIADDGRSVSGVVSVAHESASAPNPSVGTRGRPVMGVVRRTARPSLSEQPPFVRPSLGVGRWQKTRPQPQPHLHLGRHAESAGGLAGCARTRTGRASCERDKPCCPPTQAETPQSAGNQGQIASQPSHTVESGARADSAASTGLASGVVVAGIKSIVADKAEQVNRLQSRGEGAQESQRRADSSDSDERRPPTDALTTAAVTTTSTKTTTGEKTEHLKPPTRSASQKNAPLSWQALAHKYGRMSRHDPEILAMGDNNSGSGSESHKDKDTARMFGPGETSHGLKCPRRTDVGRSPGSCFWHVSCALAQTLFPILGALKHYSLPGDLLTDLVAGFTVAILHIPQGMAYGLLAGVEPIHGLYVSFIPVAVMALMSRSRHASYGTFAIISMLLVNIANEVRSTIREEQAGLSILNASGLVITDNHQPLDAAQERHKGQLLRQLVQQSAAEQQQQQQQQQQQAPPLLADPADAVDLTGALPTNIEILSCLCILCGALHVTMSLMRLGILSLIFSDQLVSSFTTAGAVHVLTSQLAGLVDLKLAPISDEFFKCARLWWQFADALVRGHFNQTTAVMSACSILFLLAVKELLEPLLRRRFKRPICLPSELLLMAMLICCVGHFKLTERHGVKIVGHVPSGLPEPKLPSVELVPYLFENSLVVALITFAMNLSIARVYAKKFRYELDPNQELLALGSANLVGSFFCCFPCASSLSRSSVQSSLNVKSQLSSLFSCLFVFLIVCYFAHVLHNLPRSTLSCIIVVALKGILMQLRDLIDNWRVSKLDAAIWIVTFAAVVAFGVTLGLVIGIVASLVVIFIRLLTPQLSVLGQLPGTDIFVDAGAFADCRELDQVRIFRFNSALCYLNRATLRSKIEKLLPGVFEPSGFQAICSQFHAGQAETGAAQAGRTCCLVIDCSAFSYCDHSGAVMLVDLIDDLADRKVCVLLAACPLKLVEMIERMPRGADVLARNVYPTIASAASQARTLQTTGGRSDLQKLP